MDVGGLAGAARVGRVCAHGPVARPLEGRGSVSCPLDHLPRGGPRALGRGAASAAGLPSPTGPASQAAGRCRDGRQALVSWMCGRNPLWRSQVQVWQMGRWGAASRFGSRSAGACPPVPSLGRWPAVPPSPCRFGRSGSQLWLCRRACRLGELCPGAGGRTAGKSPASAPAPARVGASATHDVERTQNICRKNRLPQNVCARRALTTTVARDLYKREPALPPSGVSCRGRVYRSRLRLVLNSTWYGALGAGWVEATTVALCGPGPLYSCRILRWGHTRRPVSLAGGQRWSLWIIGRWLP